MRLQTQEQIRDLALKGYGYTHIAKALDLSPNTVKSHLRRHPPLLGASVCKQCGKPIQQKPNCKEKKFCSDQCRMAWWNSHQDQVNKKAFYTLVCQQCGKEFQSYGNKNRKYCCRECFAASRRKASL